MSIQQRNKEFFIQKVAICYQKNVSQKLEFWEIINASKFFFP